MIEKCKAIRVFGDDFGDNDCTFHCDLKEGHKGKHQEGYEDYILKWK